MSITRLSTVLQLKNKYAVNIPNNHTEAPRADAPNPQLRPRLGSKDSLCTLPLRAIALESKIKDSSLQKEVDSVRQGFEADPQEF